MGRGKENMVKGNGRKWDGRDGEGRERAKWRETVSHIFSAKCCYPYWQEP